MDEKSNDFKANRKKDEEEKNTDPSSPGAHHLGGAASVSTEANTTEGGGGGLALAPDRHADQEVDAATASMKGSIDTDDAAKKKEEKERLSLAPSSHASAAAGSKGEPKQTWRASREKIALKGRDDNNDSYENSEDCPEERPGARRINGSNAFSDREVLHDVEDPPALNNTNGEHLIEAELVINEEKNVDLEAKLQERMNEKEEEIKQQIFSEAAEAQVVDVDDSSSSRKTRLIYLGLAALAMIIVVVVVVVVVTGDDEDSSPGTESPTAAPRPPTYEEHLLSLLEPLYPPEDWMDMNITQLDGGTPQNLAYRWMIQSDSLYNQSIDVAPQLLIDRFSMAVLYYATNGPEWFDQLKFLTPNTSVCEWHNDFVPEGSLVGDQDTDSVAWSGVSECGDDTETEGRITRLSFVDNSLNGILPLELSFVTSLRHLDFARNDLMGTISAEIGTKLKELEFLQLNYNYLTGTIPESFSGLLQLRHVGMIYNLLSGTVPAGLPMLDRLESIYLTSNTLEGTIPEFQKRSGIEEIVLSGNLFTGTIPESIFENERMIYLALNENDLAGSISTKIGLLRRLEDIWLNNNKLTGSIPSQIGESQKLLDVRFSHNRLTGSLPTQLGVLDNLQLLYLNNNRFTGEVPNRIFEDLTELSTLYLDSNGFEGLIPDSFSTTLAESSLLSLRIQNTSLIGDLDELMCNSTRSENWEISADCGGVQPEVTCTTCCSQCCDDINGCPFETGRGACERDRSRFDPRFCSCVPHESTEEWYVLTCNLTFAQYCNEAKQDCATYSYGYTYGEDGITQESLESFEYVSGEYTGQAVDFEETYVTSSSQRFNCQVDVNGQACNGCSKVACDDGLLTYDIKCANVQDNLLFHGCRDYTSGLLQVFHNSYDQRNWVWYNPGFCNWILPNLESDLESYSCQCSGDGLFMQCEEVECSRCLTLDSEPLCFADGITIEFEYQMVDIVNSTQDFHYISPDEHNGSVVSLFRGEGACEVKINGEVCQSCTVASCSSESTGIAIAQNASSMGLQVDCSNIPQYSDMLDGCDETTWGGSGVLQVLRPEVYSVENGTLVDSVKDLKNCSNAK